MIYSVCINTIEDNGSLVPLATSDRMNYLEALEFVALYMLQSPDGSALDLTITKREG